MESSSKIKIIALPFSGGNIYSYDVFRKNISDNFDWITYELPGRGNRISEDFLLDVNSVVDDILEKMSSTIGKFNYVIYGHSLGALLGYELAKKIETLNLPAPLFLFFTGRGSPAISDRERITDLPEEQFWTRVSEMGGTSSAILESEELKLFLAPILRSDFKISENYSYKQMSKPLSTPVFIGIGNEELIGDEKIKWEHLLKWQETTSKDFSVDFYKGDHFFIFKHSNQIIKKIEDLSTSFAIGENSLLSTEKAYT